MPPMKHRFAQIMLSCCLAAALAVPASAQTAVKKKVIRGEAIDGPPTADTPTNAAAPAPAPALAAPAKVTPVAPVTATTPAPSGSGDKEAVQKVEFTKLAGYEFKMADTPDTNQVAGKDMADQQFPADIKALNQKRIAVIGYLMPLKEVSGKATEFLIMRTQSSCCFGLPLKITEVITAKASGKGVPSIMDDLVEIEGTLKVGTMRQDGYIVGVYQMDEAKFLGRSDR